MKNKLSSKVLIIVLLFGGFSMLAQDSEPEQPPVCNPLDFTSAITADGKKVSICLNGRIRQVSVNALNTLVTKGATNPNCGCGDNAAITTKKDETETAERTKSEES